MRVGVREYAGCSFRGRGYDLHDDSCRGGI